MNSTQKKFKKIYKASAEIFESSQFSPLWTVLVERKISHVLFMRRKTKSRNYCSHGENGIFQTFSKWFFFSPHMQWIWEHFVFSPREQYYPREKFLFFWQKMNLWTVLLMWHADWVVNGFKTGQQRQNRSQGWILHDFKSWGL